MRKILVLMAVIALTLAGFTGCKTNDPGSQEFVPSKGWRPVD